jgi:pimeloyl-ACP methyl ester carboxylesterase
VDRYYDLMLGPGVRDALIARMEQTILVDPVPWLHQIKAPTLLIWGEKDMMIPFSNSEQYLKSVPNIRLVALAGVGHLPQEEEADRGLAALKAFIR